MSCLKKGMRCYRGLTTGLLEPKLRSNKAYVRLENANWKLERADLRLGRAGLRLGRPESNKLRFRWLICGLRGLI